MGFNSNLTNVTTTRDEAYPISLLQADYLGIATDKMVMFKL